MVQITNQEKYLTDFEKFLIGVKMLNILSLIIWLCWFAQGIYCCVKNKEVDKYMFLLAVFICILYYAGEILAQYC